MKLLLPFLSVIFFLMMSQLPTAEAGHSHGSGTACIVKGSYCNCHYCKCEHGQVHCGKGHKGYHRRKKRGHGEWGTWGH